MVKLGTAQTDRAWPVHDQQVAASRTRRARPLLQRRDHDEIGRSALRLTQPLSLGLRQLRRHPMRPVSALDGVIAAPAEPQRTAITGPGQIGRLAGMQPLLAGPPAQHRHRRRQLGQVDLHDRFQVRNPTLAPPGEFTGRKPAHRHQHVDHTDETTLRQHRFGGPHDTTLELVHLPSHDGPPREGAAGGEGLGQKAPDCRRSRTRQPGVIPVDRGRVARGVQRRA